MSNDIPPRLARDSDPFPTDDLPPEVADLLKFTPVPRKVNRPDGWTPDRQRQFIVLLADSGSPQRAAAEMGKQLSGVEGVYRDDAEGGFRDAWDKALAIGAARQRARDMGHGGTDRTPPHRRDGGGWSGAHGGPPIEEPVDEEEGIALFANIYQKYVLKVEQEREARLAGEVVDADFTLRQLTCIEVMLDLMASTLRKDAWEMIRAARMGEYGIIQIAETDLSRCLGEARREMWELMARPANLSALAESITATTMTVHVASYSRSANLVGLR